MSEIEREFTTDTLGWRPYVTPVRLEAASEEQRSALQVTPSNRPVSDYVLVLAHDPESLSHRTPLFNAIMYGRHGLSRAERELGATAASVVNHCVYCASVHAARYVQLTRDPAPVAEIFAAGVAAKLAPRAKAIFDFGARLSECPPAATGADIAALRAAGLTELETVDLILSVALFAWANRLMQTLGEPIREA